MPVLLHKTTYILMLRTEFQSVLQVLPKCKKKSVSKGISKVTEEAIVGGAATKKTRTRRVHTSANFRICSTFTLGVENFAFLAKVRKFKMAPIFENVFEKLSYILLKDPGGRKYRRNCSICNG